MTPPAQLPGVGRTALGVARVRAAESLREDRLFDDPLAAAFVAELAAVGIDGDPAAGGVAPGRGVQPGTGTEPAGSADPSPLRRALDVHIVIRTRFFDDQLLAACAGGCRQVVLLAAGLDTRAFRLAWPDGVHLFELDLPEVLGVKTAVLDRTAAVPACARTVVAGDLREDWPARLTAAAFDPGRPTAWLVEGLFIYLEADDAAAMLTAVGALSAAGSRLLSENGDSHAWLRGQALATPGAERLAALWRGGLGEDVGDWLEHHGWNAQRHDLGALAAGYGRPVAGGSRSGLVSAIRRPTRASTDAPG